MPRPVPLLCGAFLCACCAWALLWPGPAGAQACPPQEGGRLQMAVEIEVPPVRIRRDQSRAQLGEMSFHEPTDRVLGMMASRIEPNISWRVKARSAENGVCFWIEEIKVVLRYSALDVYVASEYSPTSCPYKAILAHEEKHAEIARRHLDAFVQPIRSALSSYAIPKPDSPLAIESAAAGEAKIRNTLERLITPIFENLRTQVEEAQNRVDTPEEYRRVRRQCRDW